MVCARLGYTCPHMRPDFSCEYDAQDGTERAEAPAEGQSGGPEVYISKQNALKLLDAASRE